MREDYFTDTERDAGRYEANCGYEGGRDDVPDARELIEDAIDMERSRSQRREHEIAAKARGEYVPAPIMDLHAAVLSMTLTEQGISGTVVNHVRPGVLAIAPAGRGGINTGLIVDVLTEHCGQRREFLAKDGVVWVRCTHDLLGDPLATNA